MMNAWLQRGRVWINRRLERRVAAYSIMVILSISLIFGAMSLAATLWIIRQQHHADSAQRFDRIVARLDDKVGLFVRHAQDLSENPIVANALLDSRGRNVYLLPFFAHYRFPLPEPHGLALCDFEGKLLAQQKWHPIGCLADLPQSRAVIDAEQPQAIFAAIEQRTHLVLFQPVFYPGTGRAEGYIVTALDLEALVAEKNQAGPQAMLTLRSNGGRIQFTVRSGAVASPPAGTGDQSIRVLFTEGPFASAGLTLTLDEPVDGLLIRGLPVFMGHGLGTLALLVLALGLSHQLARRVTEPLLTLSRTARQIATEGLTTDLIVSDRIDEIGELTASFNRMIATLLQSHEGLEAQVQARTEELRQALATVKESDEFTHIILDSMISRIAVLDRNGVILEINEPWRRFALASRNESGNMAWHPGIGVNYLEVCQKAVGEWSEDAIVACNGIQAVLAGQQSSFALEYPCHSPHEQRWFVMRVTPLGAMDGGVVIAHTDITERKQVEHLLIVQRDLLLTLEQATCPVAAMQAILDAALRLSGVDSGGIYEVDPNNGNLTLRVHYGLSATYIAAVQTRNSDSFTGRIVRAGQPRYSFMNPLYPELPNHMKTEGLRAYAVIPILHEGEAVACFNLASHRCETIPLTTCQALETLALQLGGVLMRLRTQTELEEQRINLSAVFDTLEDFLFILDEQGRILRVNPAVEQRLGCPQQDLLGRHVLEVHPPDRREEAGRIVAAMLAGQTDFCPIPLLTQSGEKIPVETRVVPGQWNGQPALIGLSRDVTERKRMQAALREQAIRDLLTGLFNRRYLDETLPRELSRCQRSGEPLAVAMLDLDHFKRFNDVYGHAAGDRVLHAVGDLLHRSLRAGDIACRYGGEELAIVMPGSSRDDARARLEDLRQALMKLQLCTPQGELPAITMSIGVAEAAPGKVFNAAELLARADDALYQAKRQGRNQVVVIAG